MAYSLLIKNGAIIDGTGKKPFVADVGVNRETIADIGNLQNENADEIIDASNLYVAPGFIDLTNHGDVYGSLFMDPLQESLLRQGVTTVLLGNCGESLAPLVKKESFQNFERWTTGFSVPVDWTLVPEYLDTLQKLGVGVNVATLVGYNTLKNNSKNLDEMSLLLERSLAGGAWGISSNFNLSERNENDKEEILKLLKIIKKYDGIHKIHLRDEGKDLLPSVNAAAELVRGSGVRTIISHLKAVGRGAWPDFNDALGIIRRAEEDGLPLYFDAFPYLRTGSMLASFLPAWARTEKYEILTQKLEDPAFYDRLISDLKKATLHADRILVASAFREKTMVGQTLREISEKIGLPPERALVEILKINDFRVTVFAKTINGKNLLAALKAEKGIVASDGAGYNLDLKRFGDLAHPRSFGTFPRFLGKLAGRAGLRIEEAVKKITSLPAEILGLKQRGVIKRKFVADLSIFHPEEFRDMATYKNSYQYAQGLRFLILGGKIAFGEDSGLYQKAGKILKRNA